MFAVTLSDTSHQLCHISTFTDSGYRLSVSELFGGGPWCQLLDREVDCLCVGRTGQQVG